MRQSASSAGAHAPPAGIRMWSRACWLTAIILAALAIAPTPVAADPPDSSHGWTIQKLSVEPLDSIVPDPIRIQAAAHIGRHTLVVVGSRLRTDGGYRDVLFAQPAVDSVTVGEPEIVNGPDGYPNKWVAVLPVDSEFVVAWIDYRPAAGLYIRRFTLEGRPAEGEVRLDDHVPTEASAFVIGSNPAIAWTGSDRQLHMVVFTHGIPGPVMTLEGTLGCVKRITGFSRDILVLTDYSRLVVHEDGSIDTLAIDPQRFQRPHFQWADSVFAWIGDDSVRIASGPFSPAPFLTAPLDSVPKEFRAASIVVRGAGVFYLLSPDTRGSTWIYLSAKLLMRRIDAGHLDSAQERFRTGYMSPDVYIDVKAPQLLRGCAERAQIVFPFHATRKDQHGRIMYEGDEAIAAETAGIEMAARAPYVGYGTDPCWIDGVDAGPLATTRVARDTLGSVSVASRRIKTVVPWDRFPNLVPQIDPGVGIVEGRLVVGWTQTVVPRAFFAARSGPADTLRLRWQSSIEPLLGYSRTADENGVVYETRVSRVYEVISAGVTPLLQALTLTDERASGTFTGQRLTAVVSLTRLLGDDRTYDQSFTLHQSVVSRFDASVVEDPNGGSIVLAGAMRDTRQVVASTSLALRPDWTRDAALTKSINDAFALGRIVPVDSARVATLDTSRVRWLGVGVQPSAFPNIVPFTSGERLLRLREQAFLRLVPSGSQTMIIERYSLQGVRTDSTSVVLPGLSRPLPSVFQGTMDRRIYVVWGAADGVRMRVLRPHLEQAVDTLIVPRRSRVASASGIIIDGGLALAWCDGTDGEPDVYAMVPHGYFGPPRDTSAQDSTIWPDDTTTTPHDTTPTPHDTTRRRIPTVFVGEMVVLPTPAMRSVEVIIGDDGAAGVLEVFDLRGRRLIARDLPLTMARIRHVNIDLTGLVPGTYFVSVRSGSRVLHSRILVAAQE